jgi:hypothetical protein
VGTERARRFYFTTERDSYAAKLGRVADFGRITATFFRDRLPLLGMSARAAGPGLARGEAESMQEGPSSSQGAESARTEKRGLERRPWRYEDGAATGMGRSEGSEIRVVAMELERQPVGEVELRYLYRHVWRGPEPMPLFAPAAEAPHRTDLGAGREELRFCPEP